MLFKEKNFRVKKKMAQAAVENCVEKKCVDIEKIILEILPGQETSNQIIKIEKKPFKTDLLNLLKKVELNTRYLEETIPIKKVDNQQYWRIYRVY